MQATKTQRSSTASCSTGGPSAGEALVPLAAEPVVPATAPRTAERARAASVAALLDRAAGISLRRRPVELFLAVALGLFLSISYFETAVNLVGRWNGDPNYSHGFLVPLVSLYLAFRKRASTAEESKSLATPRGGVFGGGVLLIGGLAIRAITIILPSLVAECFSLLAVLAGLVLVIGGRGWWRRLWASVGFLVFMVPWPSAVYSRIAFPLQLFVSRVSAIVLQILGIPVLRDGNLIHLPGQTMHVAEACSGLRQLTAFLAIGACAALLAARPRWYRLLVLASSIPIAVIMNVLRVTVSGLLLQWGDATMIEGWLHTAEGLVMVGMGLGLLMLELALLDWLLDNPSSELNNESKENGTV